MSIISLMFCPLPGIFRRRSGHLAAAAVFLPLAAALLPQPAAAQQNVFVDFSGFGTRLNELAADRGVTAFNAAEQTQIQANIVSNLQNIYSGYTVNFTQAAPVAGPFETLTFGNTTTQTGLFGISDGIDYRNLNQSNTANIYTRSFGYALAGFSGSNNRAGQISNLSVGLSGTGAHELGHNLGLQHFDSYGDNGITPANYANTGGLQNAHIMATGQTGITSAQRLTPRTFNTEEKAKLEFAQGMTLNPPPIIAEQAGLHSTLLTAQTVNFTALPISGVNAFSLTGSISAAGQTDFYAFSGTAGNKFTANILSQILSDARGAATIDSVLSIFDAGGNRLLLSDDVSFSGNTININAGSPTESRDSAFVNYLLPSTGTYYLSVADFGNGVGNYELFAYGGDISGAATPEPSTLVLVGSFGMAGMGLARRRTRKRRVA